MQTYYIIIYNIQPFTYFYIYEHTTISRMKTMNHYISYIKKVLTGKARITDKQKFSVIIYSVALVHFFLSITFGYFRVTPLFILHALNPQGTFLAGILHHLFRDYSAFIRLNYLYRMAVRVRAIYYRTDSCRFLYLLYHE